MTNLSREKVTQELADYIMALTSSEQKITPSTRLKDLNIDSISLVKIFVFIERNFQISLINAGLGKADIETLGSLVEHVVKQLPK